MAKYDHFDIVTMVKSARDDIQRVNNGRAKFGRWYIDVERFTWVKLPYSDARGIPRTHAMIL